MKPAEIVELIIEAYYRGYKLGLEEGYESGKSEDG